MGETWDAVAASSPATGEARRSRCLARRHRWRGDLRRGGRREVVGRDGPAAVDRDPPRDGDDGESPPRSARGAGRRGRERARRGREDRPVPRRLHTYTGISADALVQYSAAFDPSQYHGGRDRTAGKNFYVCSRSGKWYAEQHGLRTAAEGDEDAEPALQAVSGCTRLTYDRPPSTGGSGVVARRIQRVTRRASAALRCRWSGGSPCSSTAHRGGARRRSWRTRTTGSS